MIFLRSLIFNTLFYAVLSLYSLAAMPLLVFPKGAMIAMARAWAITNLWLLRAVCRIDVAWVGLEKLPRGPCLIASKHQSAWETFALQPLFTAPVFVLKRELLWIPLFGWCLRKCGMIPLDREAGRDTLAGLVRRTREALAAGHQVIIFPEGTRRPPGAAPDYKLGVAQLYARCDVPCVPVALNSGLFWPRRKFMRYPGTIRVEILEPIPPGMQRGPFFRKLQHDIEAATARLTADGLAEQSATGTRHAAAV